MTSCWGGCVVGVDEQEAIAGLRGGEVLLRALVHRGTQAPGALASLTRRAPRKDGSWRRIEMLAT